jgi:hypothetical protein
LCQALVQTKKSWEHDGTAAIQTRQLSRANFGKLLRLHCRLVCCARC